MHSDLAFYRQQFMKFRTFFAFQHRELHQLINKVEVKQGRGEASGQEVVSILMTF
jgi:hypothetical protein